MNSTNLDRVRQLVGALIDEHLLPLSEQRSRAGQQAYFPLAGEPGTTSYYEVPIVAEAGLADLEFPGGGTTEGLLDALAAYWTVQGEIALAASVPRLKLIAEALKEEAAEPVSSVSIFCYTMF